MIASKVFKSLIIAAAAMLMLGATANAAAAKSEHCVPCFAPPMCHPCGKDKKCVIIPATCHDCGSSYCKRVDTTPISEGKKVILKVKGEHCIQCFAPPMCPPCGKDEKCVIIPATCNDCGSGSCERI
ncbi:hypothetical protein BGZ65_000285 [Modicella reniformis]|uniref:Membrane anchor Opy2 N-terminal domain-containing protein n=1 Tax=Modicella reniformis TaxID=1440133 RepID=A0A9P6SUK5_9FUNG|nr:hypothetical protein BGZ65_000285 [Modicella reniformis]